MSSRDNAIDAGERFASRATAEAVLDAAAEARQIHYADRCPGSRTQRDEKKRLRSAKHDADENTAAVVAQRDELAAALRDMAYAYIRIQEVGPQSAFALRAFARACELVQFDDGSLRHEAALRDSLLTEPVARGVVDHYDSEGCLAVEVRVQDIGIGTHVVIYEDEP